MKNALKVAFLAAGIFTFSQSQAKIMQQDSSLGHKIGRAAKKAGHATAHVAASGASAIVDKKYDGKCGPHGETVYINDQSHYYYIDKKGHRIYLKKSQLMDKPM
ncbi:MAG: hypothetical protein JWP44_2768 [Mucilaginibacter sp.]|nr:hypothetical protein [Mucilaginibacter sp.]